MNIHVYSLFEMAKIDEGEYCSEEWAGRIRGEGREGQPRGENKEKGVVNLGGQGVGESGAEKKLREKYQREE